MSIDGKLSTRNRKQVAISGDADFERVDAMRAKYDAIMVGVGTVLADDPSLTIDAESHRAERRENDEPANPARVVADSSLRTPVDARVMDHAAATFLLSTNNVSAEAVEQAEGAGATVIIAGNDQVDLVQAFETLEDKGINDLMVEGGGTLIFSLFEADLVDELSVFIGSEIIGGRSAPTLADGDGFDVDFPQLDLEDIEQLGDGVVLRYVTS